jgi:hypothetical protein
MSSGKGSGNLRDFRIDAKTASLGTQPSQTPARQNVQPRGNSLAESTLSGAGTRAEELWNSWDQDAGEEVALPTHTPRAHQTPPTSSQVQSGQALPEEAAPSETPLIRQPWSVKLALEERKMERMGVVDFTNQYQKQEILRSKTLEFTTLLREAFTEQVEIFNEARRSAAHAIKIYRISRTEEDFMLFRNGVKLVVSGQRSGRVLFAFNQYLGQIFAPGQAPTTEIEATWGPFDQLFWSYKGERVGYQDLVEYFFSEFSRQSLR